MAMMTNGSSNPLIWPPDPKLAHLRFLRWLAERDLIEHQTLGPPSGRYAAVRPEPTTLHETEANVAR